MANAMNFYLRSRSCYRALREELVLPCRNTLFNYFGNLGLPGSVDECEKTLRNVFSNLNDGQKQCFISFDEIDIKPGVHYQGKYVLGNAVNTETPTPATTMLAAMVHPSFGTPAFVARLIPVHNMCAEFLYKEVLQLLEMVHKVGGLVYALMCDNLSVNQKVFKLFHQNFGNVSVASINHPVANEKFKMLFTLYDPVHLLKNIRNNWMTEKTQSLDFTEPHTKQEVTAKWKDLVDVYKSEIGCPLTKLDSQTLYPNNFEKQKVALACNVFNEKTVTALKVRNMEGTAAFVQNVTKMWHILNVRSTTTGGHLRDDDRYPINDPNDPKLDFLQEIATSFKLMDNCIRGYRIRGLTQETSNALHQTLLGIVELVRILLATGHKYVLLGKLQSDPIEKEFGVYRQSSGGNYFISAEQVISSLQLQRLRLFSKLDIQIGDDVVDNDCCIDDLYDSEQDLELVEKSFTEASNLSVNEKSTLYYISGYVAKKEGIICSDEYDTTILPESEFTVQLSRGGLQLPPIDLYDLSLYYYSFFKLRSAKCCTKIFLEAFQEIQNFSGYSFPNQRRINRRFVNTFFKMFVNSTRDKIRAAKDRRDTKRRRISSRL